METNKTLSMPLEQLYPLIEELLSGGQEVFFTVRGNSMAPFLRDGRDQAVFAPPDGSAVRRGDILLYARGSGQLVMHRVYAVEPTGVMTMLGDGQWTPEPGITPDHIRARVPRVIRRGRSITCRRSPLDRLMILWMLRIRYPRAAACIRRMVSFIIRCLRRITGRSRSDPARPGTGSST